MSKVNRSTYQKSIEDNKQLIADIKLLVEGGMPSPKKLLCIIKFKKEKEFNSLLKGVLRQLPP